MSENNTVIRSMHDLGLAAWFGGSLMGAVGLNGAAADVSDPRERFEVATNGWARWAPVNAAAVGMHLIGATGMLIANRDRVREQKGVGTSSIVKTALTAASVGLGAYAVKLNRDAAHSSDAPVAGATEPAPGTPTGAAKTQKQLKAVQWALPALTGALVVVSALQGEQQKPSQQITGKAKQFLTAANPLS
jgi:hypothetical protein